jgi:hypothetical protein
MIGFPLDTFNNTLTRVPVHRTKNPALTLNIAEAFGADLLEELKDDYGDVGVQTLVRRLPASVLLEKLTFDQLCKVFYSRLFMMDRSVEDLFEDSLAHAIVQKIASSMWRWGCGSGVWNEVVDTYNCIRDFNIPLDGFAVSLDFVRGTNERGYARDSQTYLDGIFGFLVHYKGEHVMTLGFSIMKGRRVLVQQVQLTQRKGNRFLFKLPPNRVEFFLACFASAFPRHRLCMADGGDIGNVSLQSYERQLEHVLDRIKDKPEPRHLQAKVECEQKIAHLTAELPRLAALYANTGKFTQTQSFQVNHVRHYALSASPQITAATRSDEETVTPKRKYPTLETRPSL